MDADNSDAAPSRLLDSVPFSDAELAAQILAACPTVDVVAGEPYFRSSLTAGTLRQLESDRRWFGVVANKARVPRADCEPPLTSGTLRGRSSTT